MGVVLKYHKKRKTKANYSHIDRLKYTITALANRIQQYTKNTMDPEKVRFIPEMQNWSDF